jgi:hypothetical protein
MSGGGGTQVSTSSTAPWEAQKEYLKSGFSQAKSLYNRGAPDYYGKETMAGFDPAQSSAQSSTLGYTMGPRVAGQQAAAENRLIQGLGADVDTARMTPVMDYLGRQMKSNLETNVLPGIRQSLVQYQPGGSTRGDTIQSMAIAKANQQMLDKGAEMAYQAYGGAQDRAQNYAQMYPSIMSAPLNMYGAMGDVGAQRRAMTQETMDKDMARYQYDATAPQQQLANYMNMISGNYGGTTTQTTPGKSGMDQIGQAVGIASSLYGMSDSRMKENVEFDGTWKGHNVYTYNFKGSNTRSRGVMAQEIEITRPDAVMEIEGIKHVNYGVL